MSLFVHESDEEQLDANVNGNSNSSCVSFTASTTQIAHLSDIFQSLISINNQAIIKIKARGISIYSCYNHTFSVHVNIDPTLFNIYNITTSEVSLGVDINLITECFTSVVNTLKFEKSVTCYFNYQGEGSPLIIEFEDNYISEKLEFFTFYIDNDLEDSNLLFIDHQNISMELMVKCDVLTNILQDLNQISTENLFVYVAEDTLNFISNGPIGTSKLIFPNDKAILEKLEIMSSDKKYVISQFNFEMFYKIFKSVKLSSKCKIIKDSHGCFSIQLLCKNLPQTKYSGTLITINMMELNHDEYMVGWILNDNAEEQELENTLKEKLVLHKQPNLLPTSVRVANEPLINSFRKSRHVEVQASMVDPESETITDSSATNDTLSRKRKRKERRPGKNVGGAVEIPLYL
ncbi:RAD17 DNA damage checkpoint control protein RAD17 [Candida maltosa Xu316]